MDFLLGWIELESAKPHKTYKSQSSYARCICKWELSDNCAVQQQLVYRDGKSFAKNWMDVIIKVQVFGSDKVWKIHQARMNEMLSNPCFVSGRITAVCGWLHVPVLRLQAHKQVCVCVCAITSNGCSVSLPASRSPDRSSSSEWPQGNLEWLVHRLYSLHIWNAQSDITYSARTGIVEQQWNPGDRNIDSRSNEDISEPSRDILL